MLVAVVYLAGDLWRAWCAHKTAARLAARERWWRTRGGASEAPKADE